MSSRVEFCVLLQYPNELKGLKAPKLVAYQLYTHLLKELCKTLSLDIESEERRQRAVGIQTRRLLRWRSAADVHEL